MSRILSVYTQGEIVKAVTKPRYCIQLDWNQLGFMTERWCTAADVPWNGFTWYYTPVEVTQLQIADSNSVATVQYIDNDQSFRVLTLSANLLDSRLDIWQLYGTGPYVAEDGEHLFTGKIKSISGESGDMRLTIHATGQSQGIAPKAGYSVPEFNHIPAPESTLQVGTTRIRVS